MTHKHAVGTMSSNIFLAIATDHKEKKWHDASNANEQTKITTPTVFDRWAMKNKTEWEKSVLYNAANAVRTTARKPFGKKHK